MSKDNARTKKNSEWERNRRDRLNESFLALSRLLPSFDESKSLSKIEIINQARCFIVELLEQNKRLLMGDEAKENVQKEKIHYLTERVRHLLSRNAQLATIIKESNIKIPTNEDLRKTARQNRHNGKLKHGSESTSKVSSTKSHQGQKNSKISDTNNVDNKDKNKSETRIALGSVTENSEDGDQNSNKKESVTTSDKPINDVIKPTKAATIFVVKNLNKNGKNLLPRAPNGKVAIPSLKSEKIRNRERDVELLKGIKVRKMHRKNGLDSKLQNLQKKLDDDRNFDAELKLKKVSLLKLKSQEQKTKKIPDRIDKQQKEINDDPRQTPNKKQCHKNYTIDSLCAVKQNIDKTDKSLPNNCPMVSNLANKEIADQSAKVAHHDSLGLNLSNNYELSNDLLQSFHTQGHNTESLSPTAAFLINFPLVSSGTNGKSFEEESSSNSHTNWVTDKDSAIKNVENSGNFCMMNESSSATADKFYLDLGRNSTNFRSMQSIVSNAEKRPKDGFLESFDQFNEFTSAPTLSSINPDPQNYFNSNNTYPQIQVNDTNKQIKKVKSIPKSTVNWMTTPHTRNLPPSISSSTNNNIDYLFHPYTNTSNNTTGDSFMDTNTSQDWSTTPKYHPHTTSDNIPSTLPTLIGDLALNTTNTTANSFNNFSVSHLMDQNNLHHDSQIQLQQPQPHQQNQLDNHKVPNKNWNFFDATNKSQLNNNNVENKTQERKNWMDLNFHKSFQYSAESLLSSTVPNAPPSDIWSYQTQKLPHNSDCSKNHGTNTFTPKVFPTSSNDYHHDLMLSTNNSTSAPLPSNTFDFDPINTGNINNGIYNLHNSSNSNDFKTSSDIFSTDWKNMKKPIQQQPHSSQNTNTSTKLKFNNDFNCLDNLSYYNGGEFTNLNYSDEFQQQQQQQQQQHQMTQNQSQQSRNYYPKTQQNLSDFHMNTIIHGMVSNKNVPTRNEFQLNEICSNQSFNK